VVALQGRLQETVGKATNGQQKPSVHVIEGFDLTYLEGMRIAPPVRQKGR
jgi:hypothetical protein